jgi:hypothetical protein
MEQVLRPILVNEGALADSQPSIIIDAGSKPSSQPRRSETSLSSLKFKDMKLSANNLLISAAPDDKKLSFEPRKLFLETVKSSDTRILRCYSEPNIATSIKLASLKNDRRSCLANAKAEGKAVEKPVSQPVKRNTSEGDECLIQKLALKGNELESRSSNMSKTSIYSAGTCSLSNLSDVALGAKADLNFRPRSQILQGVGRTRTRKVESMFSLGNMKKTISVDRSLKGSKASVSSQPASRDGTKKGREKINHDRTDKEESSSASSPSLRMTVGDSR